MGPETLVSRSVPGTFSVSLEYAGDDSQFTREGLYNALIVTAALFVVGGVASAVGIRNPLTEAAVTADSAPDTASDDGGSADQRS